ncbi:MULTISPECIES: YdaS family helix-turn-helix protein [unclassified Delftia]|uniref:YdaS family helix-turn-helix protein n=1 Tax=unclassified Delftia TaxID=2613839 RepID=UPI0019019A7D|nr:helix-turn-helix domain-containing protein [Delftia sp. S65]MBK0120032.1 helix-turn-helix domain-containing protein [Delftia sp. S67]MBK0133213.1 helix-turn-helix domain-containing protein [Delftia sp. S66]
MTRQTALNPHDALLAAIKKAGGQAALARLIGKKQGHVSYWLDSGNGVPAEYCPLIEEGTGVLCEQLRPRVRWDVLLRRGADAAGDTNA